MLASRLSRHGVSLSVSSLAVFLAQESAAASFPPRLIDSTAQAASLVAAGGAVAGVVPTKVAALTGEVMKMMLLFKIKVVTAMFLVASALIAGGTNFANRAPGSEPASLKEAPRTKGQDQRNDDPTVTRSQDEQRRKEESTRPTQDDPTAPGLSSPPEEEDHVLPAQAPSPDPPPPMPTTGQDQHTEDPLADLIVAGDHTPEQLERAKMMIDSMITLEKEAHGKSPVEIDKMIKDKASKLEEARWEVRVMDAQLRRLNAIKRTTHGSVPDEAQ